MSDSERPTDPAPAWAAPDYVGDPVLYLIDRVANLSDALLSPEGVVSRQHQHVVGMLKTLTDAVFRIEAKVNELSDEQDVHGARLTIVERHHHAGNGAAK